MRVLSSLLLSLASISLAQFAEAARVCVESMGDTCLRYEERADVSLAQKVESEIKLSRSDWRKIQASLRAGGHYRSSIDGLVGSGTRGAVRAWQRENGHGQTGFLTGAQARILISSAPPISLSELSSFQDCPVCPEMVVISSGSFLMGSPPNETNREADEGPQHRVTLRTFALARTPVTFDQWQRCVSDGGCRTNRQPDDEGWGRGDRPVINVNWHEAQEYIDWLNGKVKSSPYRLPSEAEWEYAARAGTTTPYPWGPNASHEQANYGADECCDGKIFGRDKWMNTAPVGRFPENGWNLHDLIGNVWEWAEDCWNDDYNGAPADGTAWTRGDCARRVLRGGSWYVDPSILRVANRSRKEAEVRSLYYGFRPAKTLLTP